MSGLGMTMSLLFRRFQIILKCSAFSENPWRSLFVLASRIRQESNVSSEIGLWYAFSCPNSTSNSAEISFRRDLWCTPNFGPLLSTSFSKVEGGSVDWRCSKNVHLLFHSALFLAFPNAPDLFYGCFPVDDFPHGPDANLSLPYSVAQLNRRVRSSDAVVQRTCLYHTQSLN